MKVINPTKVSNATPAVLTGATGTPGTDSSAARSDHRHAIGPITGTVDWGNQAITNLNNAKLTMNAGHFLTVTGVASNTDWTLALPGNVPSGASFLRVMASGVASFDQATYATVLIQAQGVGAAGAGTWYFGMQPYTGAEATIQAATGQGGTARYLSVTISGNANLGATTFTVRKNGADTTLTLSVPAATTGVFQDLTHAPVFAGTDLVSLAMTLSNAGLITPTGVLFEITQS